MGCLVWSPHTGHQCGYPTSAPVWSPHTGILFFRQRRPGGRLVKPLLSRCAVLDPAALHHALGASGFLRHYGDDCAAASLWPAIVAEVPLPEGPVQFIA